jgi:hypothetical protein
MAEFLETWHLSHPLLAAFAVLAGAVCRRPRYGAVFAVGFYYGREVAHVGARWADNPWWWGFDLTRWSRDNHLDFWPVVVTVAALVLAIERLWGSRRV